MNVLEGNTAQVLIDIVDTATGDPIDPSTLDVVVTNPDATFSSYTFGSDPELTRLSTGRYELSWVATPFGRYYWYSVATGTGEGTGEGVVDVTPKHGEIGFVEPVAYAPTVEDLARLLPSRAAARFTGGTGAPSFPDENRVQAVIDWAVGTVSARLGLTRLPAKFYDAARHLIVLRAALTLEPAAWPEQARPDKSAWDQWKLLYDEDLAGLIAVIKLDADDGDDGDGGPETLGWLPAGGFPPPGVQYPGSVPCGVFGPGSPDGYPYAPWNEQF